MDIFVVFIQLKGVRFKGNVLIAVEVTDGLDCLPQEYKIYYIYHARLKQIIAQKKWFELVFCCLFYFLLFMYVFLTCCFLGDVYLSISVFWLFFCFVSLFSFFKWFCFCSFSPILWQKKKVLNTLYIDNNKQQEQHSDTTTIHASYFQSKLLMLNKSKKNAQNDTSNARSAVIKDAIINHINHDILKTIFNNFYSNFDFTDWYCFKAWNILSIIFCDIVFVWQAECVRITIRQKKIQKMCKDNENNRKNRNDGNGALLFNCINTLLNGLNTFLINVEYYKCGIFNTNICKLDENDGSQCLIVKKLDGILIRNSDNIFVVLKFILIRLFAISNTAYNLYALQGCESILRLSLSLSCILILLIDRIVIMAMIEMILDISIISSVILFSAACDTTIATVTNNVLTFFAQKARERECEFKYDAVVLIVTSNNCFEAEGELEYAANRGPASTVTGTISIIIVGIGIHDGFVKDGYEYDATTVPQPIAGVGAGIYFVNGFNNGIFEYRLETSHKVLLAIHIFKNLNGLIVRTTEESESEEVGAYLVLFVFVYWDMQRLEMKEKEK